MSNSKWQVSGIIYFEKKPSFTGSRQPADISLQIEQRKHDDFSWLLGSVSQQLKVDVHKLRTFHKLGKDGNLHFLIGDLPEPISLEHIATLLLATWLVSNKGPNVECQPFDPIKHKKLAQEACTL